MKKNFNSIFQFVSILVTFCCILYVGYRGEECLAKYLRKPKVTDVTIQHAKVNIFPSISVCYNNLAEAYESTLKECNLTYKNYFDEFNWLGKTDKEFCNDTKKLYEKMTGSPFILIESFTVETSRNNFNVTEGEFTLTDDPYNGRCFKYDPNLDETIVYIRASFWWDATIYVHDPRDYYGSDYKELKVELGKYFRIDITHEIFKVFDLDGESCIDYQNQSRDKCLHDSIFKVLCTYYK